MSRKAEPPTVPGPAAIFAALGHETRLGLVVRLSSEGPQSIASLTANGQVSRQAVTKHLIVLEGAGLARSRKKGRERVWELELRRLDDARRFLDVMSESWDTALERLRALVEDTPGEEPS